MAPSPTPTSKAELVVGGDRPVTVHLPAAYDASRPAPLLLLLHGYSGSGALIDDYFGLADLADEQGYVYATPDGTVDKDGNRFWNATDACCAFDRQGVDDEAYLTDVIAEIQGKLAIDPKRIAVAGWSNGGFMSYRMACDHADLVAAMVSLAGTTFADPAECTPSGPVSVAQVHGTADDVIDFDGGVLFDDPTRPYPGAKATAKAWATYDGCGATGSTSGTRVDVDAVLTDGGDPAETPVEEWSGCDADATVQLWAIPNAGHEPRLTAAFADSVIRFLVEHPKP